MALQPNNSQETIKISTPQRKARASLLAELVIGQESASKSTETWRDTQKKYSRAPAAPAAVEGTVQLQFLCFLLGACGNLLLHFREKTVRVMEIEDKNIQGNDLQQQLIVLEMLRGPHPSPPSSPNPSLKKSSEIRATSLGT